MKTLFGSAALAAMLAATAWMPAMAESGPMAKPAMGMMGGECPVMGMMGAMNPAGASESSQTGSARPGGMHGHRSMGPMIEGRLAYLKASLEITADQEAAWTGFAEAMKGRIAGMQSMRQTMMTRMSQGTATDMMDMRIEGLQAMIDALKAMKASTAALYAVLDDDQKKVADQLIGRDCGPM